jgi:histidine triad (HIT) family protein
MSCLFCRIIAGELPATIVYRDDDIIAFRDVNPQAPTHILVIPTRHIASIADTQDSDIELLGRLIAVARQVAQTEKLSGYRLVVNTGAQAGQSVFHLHVHLLGGRRMTWPPG